MEACKLKGKPVRIRRGPATVNGRMLSGTPLLDVKREGGELRKEARKPGNLPERQAKRPSRKRSGIGQPASGVPSLDRRIAGGGPSVLFAPEMLQG
ncbi:hypothetical protein QJ48_25325 [Paenibacillus sp. A3]|nr:hypothetical protein QJ48_25325 [Paenibacillus sp. A3]